MTDASPWESVKWRSVSDSSDGESTDADTTTDGGWWVDTLFRAEERATWKELLMVSVVWFIIALIVVYGSEFLLSRSSALASVIAYGLIAFLFLTTVAFLIESYKFGFVLALIVINETLGVYGTSLTTEAIVRWGITIGLISSGIACEYFRQRREYVFGRRQYTFLYFLKNPRKILPTVRNRLKWWWYLKFKVD